MEDKGTKDYKGNYKPELQREIEEDVEEHLEAFKNPIVLAEIYYKVMKEREDTNRLLKTILMKLEAIESKGMQPKESKVLLSDLEERIVDYIAKNEAVCAEDVQAEFGYKGQNGASMRLNKLYQMGVLEKRQVGRKVYFTLK
ncbi:MAG: winged helix-turn-helix domain-containing protein [Candidatus Anstonellales archaeon]